jgi:hypothetical protein
MKKVILRNTIVLVSILLTLMMLSSHIPKKTTKQSVANHVVVLELFTSQGCSSCPSADAILGKYAIENNPNIIPLAFHVEYWNRLGWTDVFSKKIHSERQNAYAQSFHSTSVYTPQLLINGKHELVGCKKISIEKLVKKELESDVTLKVSIDSIVVKCNHLNVLYSFERSKDVNFINLALVKKKEITHIKSGENGGINHTNYNIVVDFIRVQTNVQKIKNVLFPFNKKWNPSEYMVVAYLQNGTAGKILGGAKKELSK